jgi:hypothetical protein
MPEFFEYDPLYNIKTETAWDEATQQITVHRSSDVQAHVDLAKAKANDDEYSRRGIKESWWQYATIPPIQQLQLRAKGLDVGNPEHFKRIVEEINLNMPDLKTTQGKMYGTPTVYFDQGAKRRGRK